MEWINGGVTAANGFKANAVHCGVRKKKDKLDLALIYSETPCTAAAVYTQNLVKGAPITVTQTNLQNGTAKAVIANSGNANTCNADGVLHAQRMCVSTAKALGVNKDDIIVASTGVIGQPLPVELIENSMEKLAQGLTDTGSHLAADAIMTTDLVAKECAVKFQLGNHEVMLGGIAKGSGMIHPNMATLLSFVTTDCGISTQMLQKAITNVAETTFNMISVDGDTSTNDTFAVLANGLAQNPEINSENADFKVFQDALHKVCKKLAMEMAKDGEGATKLLVCKTTGAKDLITAKIVAKSIICSSLVKTAMFGADANWGRILCAIGYSGADVDVNRIDVGFSSEKGEVAVCVNGAGIPFSEEVAAEVLSAREIQILVDLHEGECFAESFGCDLTYDYVKINGDYRT